MMITRRLQWRYCWGVELTDTSLTIRTPLFMLILMEWAPAWNMDCLEKGWRLCYGTLFPHEEYEPIFTKTMERVRKVSRMEVYQNGKPV